MKVFKCELIILWYNEKTNLIITLIVSELTVI